MFIQSFPYCLIFHLGCWLCDISAFRILVSRKLYTQLVICRQHNHFEILNVWRELCDQIKHTFYRQNAGGNCKFRVNIFMCFEESAWINPLCTLYMWSFKVRIVNKICQTYNNRRTLDVPNHLNPTKVVERTRVLLKTDVELYNHYTLAQVNIQRILTWIRFKHRCKIVLPQGILQRSI